MLKSRRASRGESGFTLIELLITITILGVIAVPLSLAVTTFALNGAKVGARLNESKDQQTAAAYWQQDVSSIGTRDTTGAATNAINVAGADCGSPGPSKVITLSWTRYDLDGTPSIIRVTYATASAGTALVRTVCGAMSTPAVRVARRIDAATAIQCSLSGSAYTSCDSLSGTGGTTLNLRFRVKDSSNKGAPYTVTLLGQRRQS